MGQTGSSEKNALLNSDAFTLNTKGLKNLAKGVHFEKDEDFEYTDQQKKRCRESGGLDCVNHCDDDDIDDGSCDGFTAFQTLVNKMQVQQTLDTGDYITTETFKNEFGEFAPEAKNANSSTKIIKEFVNQIQSQFNDVNIEVDKANNRVLNAVCENATCLDKTDITSWLSTAAADQFKSNMKGYVLDNAFSHTTGDSQEWKTKLGAELKLQDNVPVLDALLNKISTGERAAKILNAVSNNDFNIKMGSYMEADKTASIEGDHHLNKKFELMKNDPVPKGTIIAWKGSGDPPTGWALCDGKTASYIDSSKNPPEAVAVETPDLRARFIMGAIDMDGQGGSLNEADAKGSNRCPMVKNEKEDGTIEYKCDLNQLKFSINGDRVEVPIGVGSATHTLTEDEMAKHQHLLTHGSTTGPGGSGGGGPYISMNAGTGSGSTHNYRLHGQSQEPNTQHKSGFTGGDKPHNNLPPYYVLSYIIKL